MFEDFKLKVFTAVAEEGNFTKAALRLGISQPAVSQNIADLEKSFGVKLFERQRGYVELTPQGTIFKSYTSEILCKYDELTTIFSNYEKIAATTNLRIAVAPAYMQLFSATMIPYIYTLVPAVSLSISTKKDDATDLSIEADGSVATSSVFEADPLCPLLKARYLSVKPE